MNCANEIDRDAPLTKFEKFCVCVIISPRCSRPEFAWLSASAVIVFSFIIALFRYFFFVLIV